MSRFTLIDKTLNPVIYTLDVDHTCAHLSLTCACIRDHAQAAGRLFFVAYVFTHTHTHTCKQRSKLSSRDFAPSASISREGSAELATRSPSCAIEASANNTHNGYNSESDHDGGVPLHEAGGCNRRLSCPLPASLLRVPAALAAAIPCSGASIWSPAEELQRGHQTDARALPQREGDALDGTFHGGMGRTEDGAHGTARNGQERISHKLAAGQLSRATVDGLRALDDMVATANRWLRDVGPQWNAVEQAKHACDTISTLHGTLTETVAERDALRQAQARAARAFEEEMKFLEDHAQAVRCSVCMMRDS
jgi:hypothetical protein